MLSVAICTRNRANLLRGTLESLAQMRVTAGLEWELILVDNGSSDDTRAISDEFASRLPLRYVLEPEPGHSHARNRAVREFGGEYVLWTDDDVRVEEQWLSAYAEAFQRWPEAAVFGGPIRPRFEGTPPSWLPGMLEEVGSAYAIRDLSPEDGRLDFPGTIPFGANFAVRGDVQRDHPYDVRLGLSPSRPNLRGEETDVIRSILASGHDGRWVPEAVVQHWVPKSRQTWTYLWRYYFGAGQRRVLDGYTNVQYPILNRPRWLWRQIVERPLRFAIAGLRGDSTGMGRELRESAVYWGMFLGAD